MNRLTPSSFGSALDVLFFGLPPQPPLGVLRPVPMGVDTGARAIPWKQEQMFQHLSTADRPRMVLAPPTTSWIAARGDEWFRSLSKLILLQDATIEVFTCCDLADLRVQCYLTLLKELSLPSGSRGGIRIFKPRHGGMPPLVRRMIGKWRERPFMWMDQPGKLWISETRDVSGRTEFIQHFDARGDLDWDLEWRLYGHSIALIREHLEETS